MADDALSFSVSLIDKITGPAKAAGKQVASLADVLKHLDDQSIKDAQDIDKVSKQFVAMQAAAKQAQQDKLDEHLKTIADREDRASQASGALTAKVGTLALKLAAGAAAAAGLAVVLGAKLAVEASQTRIQMTAMFDALGQGKLSGEQTIKMLDELGTTTGLTKEKLVPFVSQFEAMGIVAPEALKKMTTAAASANAIMRDPAAGDAFVTLQRKIQEAADTGTKLKIPAKSLASLAQMGVKASDVAAKMGLSSKALAEGLKAGTINATKFGDALSAVLIGTGKEALDASASSVDALKAKFAEGIGEMFKDVNTKPLLDGLRDLLKLFDQNTAAGKAIHDAVTTVFDGLFKVVAALLPTVKHLFLEMVVGALKIYIAAKPLVAELKKLFGAGDGDTVSKALMFIVDFMVSGVVFTLKFYTLMLKVWAAITGVAKAIVSFQGDAVKAGSAFVDGLIKGIFGGEPLAVKAVKSLGNKMVDGIKSTLGIHSPSRVMMQLGQHTSEGFALGIEAKSPRAQGAMSSMASPPSAGGGKSGHSIVINISGVEGAAELKQEFPAMLAAAFERLQLQGAGA